MDKCVHDEPDPKISELKQIYYCKKRFIPAEQFHILQTSNIALKIPNQFSEI